MTLHVLVHSARLKNVYASNKLQTPTSQYMDSVMKPRHLPQLTSYCTLLAFSLWACNVGAQTKAPENTAKVGLGLVLNDEGYKGLGIKTTLVPALQIQTTRFSVRGTSAEYLLTNPENQDFSVNLRADLLLQGYKASDAAIFTGMARRKPSLLLGVGTKFATPIGQVWLEAGSDVSGNSKGLRTEAGLGWRIDSNSALGKWSLRPYVSVQNNSSKLVNYYYGVTAAEAAAGRPAYEAGAATNFNIGLSASTDLSPNISLVLGARYRGYGASIRQSPLIDGTGGLSGTASVLYRLY
jgi:MipA family protein